MTLIQYFVYCRKSTEDDDHQSISLESQRTELLRFAAARGLQIREVLSESRSARLPGRPIFNHMMARIRNGEAKGIIAWHPDRLARNSVDGGRIIHFLDTGRLCDLQFPTYVFEEGPQGKFMLAIVFGHSKYQVDILRESVRRGNRTKREMGCVYRYLQPASRPTAAAVRAAPIRSRRNSGVNRVVSRLMSVVETALV